MKIKTQRKKKMMLLSTAFICLFAISFALNVQAADAPIMSISHVSNYTPKDYPIQIYANFDWDIGINRQTLLRVYLYYSVNSLTIDEDNYISYIWTLFDSPRPLSVVLTIPTAALVAGDTIRFKVTAVWKPAFSQEVELVDNTKYKIDIQEEDWEEQGNLIMIIGISAGVAVFVCIVLLVYVFRKRRR